MKYIYVSHLRYPSEITHSIFAVRTCEAFARKGIGIEMWVPKRNNFKYRGIKVMEYYSVEPHFPVKKLPVIDLTQIFPGKWPFFLMVFSFNFSIFFYAIYRGLLRKGLFYIHDIRDVIILSVFNPKFVFEVHDFFKSSVSVLNNKIYPKIGAFIATNSIKAESLNKEYRIKESIILNQPNAVDFDKFQFSESKEESRKKLGLPLDKKIILYPGGYALWKGPQVLLEASKYLDSDTIVYFVGSSELEAFRKKADKINPKNFVIVGWVDHSNIPLWFNSSDILVLPNSGKSNASKYETSPVKLFEYMASGIPSIVSDLPSIRYVVNDEMVWFFEPDNSKDLANKIREAIKNPNQSKLKRAKEEAKKHTWSKRAENILNFLISLGI